MPLAPTTRGASVIPESHVPYPRRGRLWDDTLTGVQRLRRLDFLLGLGLDPSRVPDGAHIDHDPRTGEYRVQYINRAGHLVWVRRLWSLPPPGPRQFGAITAELADLREWYGDGTGLPAPERLLAAWRASPQDASVSGLLDAGTVRNPVITYSPRRVADTLDATAARYGLARERVGYMMGRGA